MRGEYCGYRLLTSKPQLNSFSWIHSCIYSLTFLFWYCDLWFLTPAWCDFASVCFLVLLLSYSSVTHTFSEALFLITVHLIAFLGLLSATSALLLLLKQPQNLIWVTLLNSQYHFELWTWSGYLGCIAIHLFAVFWQVLSHYHGHTFNL